MSNTQTLNVTGMSCNHCAMKVEKALNSVEGVESASVDLASKSATVVYDENRVKPIELVAAVVESGYEAAEA